jgi:hypothetical protein
MDSLIPELNADTTMGVLLGDRFWEWMVNDWRPFPTCDAGKGLEADEQTPKGEIQRAWIGGTTGQMRANRPPALCASRDGKPEGTCEKTC